MKKRIAAVLLTTVITGVLCGCGAGAGEPAAQDGEAQSGGRPVFVLQNHSRMAEQGLTLIASGFYDTVRLTEEAAIDYPQLNKAIEAENELIKEEYEKTFTEVKEAAESAIANKREDTEEFPQGNVEGKIVPVRCDGSVLSFYDVTSLYYPGAAHGSVGYTGYNYRPENGERITLADVFKDPAALKPVVAKYLRAQADGSTLDDAEDILQYYFDEGLDDLKWVIDQEGVTFLFAPSDIAPYAMGTLESRIPFDEEAALFTGNFGPSEDGFVRTMSPFTEMNIDLDGDGSGEKLSVTGTYKEGNEIYEYSGIRVSVGNQVCETELNCYSIQPYFVHTGDGRNYVYVITGTDSDYPELSVFEIGDKVPASVGKIGGTGLASAFYPTYVDGEYKPEESYSERYSLIDPSKFALGTRMQLMSSYSGRRFYEVGEDGMPAPLTDYYEIEANITLTSLVPLKAETVDLVTQEPTGEEKEIPAGTKLRFWRTNGVDIVDLRTEDMEAGEAFRFKVETGDGQTVNGVKLEEAFDGTMFGG